ncbi:MAG: signal recognition particle-docking protein FtsY [Flavobacteriaceae bacterium]
MARKPGFFRRLFGLGAPEPEDTPELEARAPAEAPPAPEAEKAEKPKAPEPKAEKPKAQKPEPKAKPKPEAKPKPAAKPKPTTKPKAEPKPAPKAEPEPAPAPEPVPAPEPRTPPAPEPVPEPEPVAEAAPEPVPAPAPEPEPAPQAEAPRKSWFARLKDGLSRSSNALSEGIANIVSRRKLDDETIQDLEDVLIQADLGVDTAMRITEALAESRYDKTISPEEVRKVLAAEVSRVLEPVARPLKADSGASPHVILVVGVNGTGKTTTIGKLAQKFARDGRKVMLAAGDTFRAAAIEQLKIWGERAGAPVIARDTGADAAGLAFDAMKEAREQGRDILLIDTAGRLQNKADLMAELEKVIRVIRKQDETAPHDVLLVLDATTGQNAVQQAEIFTKVAGVTGIVMTKLDGTARGGILVAIAAKYGLPVHFIGVGEGIDDLQPFEAAQFADAIAGSAAEAAS